LLRDMPPHLPQAVIATEDRRFYEHAGVDPYGLARAMWTNLLAMRVVQGGSTITQQLAKNVFLNPERSLRRKAQEFLLALWLERKFTKERILELYLNRVYFGSGAYGISAASQKYFGKKVSHLTMAESAMLAGLLKAPSRYNPVNDRQLARGRLVQVLANMQDAGYIAPQDQTAALNQKLIFNTTVNGAGSQYFFDWVLDQLPEYIGQPQGDLIVVTSLDARLQEEAEKTLAAALEKEGARLSVRQGALLTLGADGAVRAMAGGRSYSQSQFNRATQAKRQPGSAFKPFVYLTALEAGLTPDSVMRDSPIILKNWQPRNFKKGYAGEVTLRYALSESINTVAVKLSEMSGRQNVIETARRLGIQSKLAPTPAVALGVSEVSLLELTSAYVPFSNGGFAAAPYGILKVHTPQGLTLYERKEEPRRQVVNWRAGQQMNEMLENALSHGTGRAARLAYFRAAGKTGTSQNYRDGWFMGYSNDLVTGVWFGNDDGAPMKSVTGGGLPARTWKTFMEAALKEAPAQRLSSGSPVVQPVKDLVSRFWRSLGGGN
jgi:penicillin-binding protein 1A